MSKQKIYIYGAGGFGREVRAWLGNIPEWEVAGFLDDGIKEGTIVDGIRCLGGWQALKGMNGNPNVVLGLGDPRTKERIATEMGTLGTVQFPVLVHPGAILLDRASMSFGEGTLICAGCVLTTGIVLGKHVLLNLLVTVGHFAKIGSYSSLMPGVNVAGDVELMDNVYVGSGACFINAVKVGKGAVVGSGAVVLKEVPPDTTVVGVPAVAKAPRP